MRVLKAILKSLDFILLDDAKLFKNLKQGTNMLRISFLEDHSSCSMRYGLESEEDWT